MKRLMTLMLACAAILVMAIAATAARADHGADDNTTTAAQPCDSRQDAARRVPAPYSSSPSAFRVRSFSLACAPAVLAARW